jgi:hypothetical protein
MAPAMTAAMPLRKESLPTMRWKKDGLGSDMMNLLETDRLHYAYSANHRGIAHFRLARDGGASYEALVAAATLAVIVSHERVSARPDPVHKPERGRSCDTSK